MTKATHTKGLWTNGYGEGITGPTTPAVDGPTVEEQIQWDRWHKQLSKGEMPPTPKPLHTVVSVGKETIAIVVGPNREANARLIAASPALKEALEFLADEITAAQKTYRKLARRLLPAHVIYERLKPIAHKARAALAKTEEEAR